MDDHPSEPGAPVCLIPFRQARTRCIPTGGDARCRPYGTKTTRTTLCKPEPPPGQTHADGPRLLADIGGTNARFALETAPGRIEQVQVLRGADYPQFTDAVQAYLKLAGQPPVRHAVVAIANPVQGDQIKMTNHDWAFSIEAARQLLGLDLLLVVNDFTALSMAVPQLRTDELQQIGGARQEQASRSAWSVPAPGWVWAAWCAVTATGCRWPAKAGTSPSPRPMRVKRRCWPTPGNSMNTSRLNAWSPARSGIHPSRPAGHRRSSGCRTEGRRDRGRRTQARRCDLPETLDLFCSMLGTVAADLALTLGALGGIYIGGGVVPHLGNTSPVALPGALREQGAHVGPDPGHSDLCDHGAISGLHGRVGHPGRPPGSRR
jgi:glucokinase